MSRPEAGPGGAIRLLVGDEHGQLKVVTWKDRGSLSLDPTIERWLKAPLDRSRGVSALAVTVLPPPSAAPAAGLSEPPAARALAAVGRKDGTVEILDALSGAPVANVLPSDGQLEEEDEERAEAQDRVVRAAAHAGRTAGGRSEEARDDDEVVAVFFVRGRGAPQLDAEPERPAGPRLSLLRVTRGGLATLFPLCPTTGARLPAPTKRSKKGSARGAAAHPSRAFPTTPAVCAADVDPSHRFLLMGSNGAEPRVYWIVDREEDGLAEGGAGATGAPAKPSSSGAKGASPRDPGASLFGTVAFHARGPGANKFRLVETPWINAVAFSKTAHLASSPLVGPPDVAPPPGAKGNVAEPSPVPPFAVATGKAHRVRLYRPSSGRKPRTDEPIGEARATAVACEPASGRLWVADGLGLVAEVRRADGKLGGVLKGPRGSIRSIAFGGDEWAGYQAQEKEGEGEEAETKGAKGAEGVAAAKGAEGAEGARSAERGAVTASQATAASAGLAAAVGLDRFVRVWDTATRKKKAQAYLKTHLTVVAFLPTEEAFARDEQEEEEAGGDEEEGEQSDGKDREEGSEEEGSDGEEEDDEDDSDEGGSEEGDEDDSDEGGSEEGDESDSDGEGSQEGDESDSDEAGSEEEEDDGDDSDEAGSEEEEDDEGDSDSDGGASDSEEASSDDEPAPSPPRKRATAAPRGAARTAPAPKKRRGA